MLRGSLRCICEMEWCSLKLLLDEKATLIVIVEHIRKNGTADNCHCGYQQFHSESPTR
jgi:hypothetical protein